MWSKSFPSSPAGKEFTCNAGGPSSTLRLGTSAGEEISYPLQHSWASLVAQLVKKALTEWETPVRFLAWEDSPEKGMATPLQYSGLENFVDFTVHGVAKSRTQLSNFHSLIVQWLGLCALTCCGPRFSPWLGNWDLASCVVQHPPKKFLVDFLIIAMLVGYEVVSHCSFDLNFSDHQWYWASFHVLIGHLFIFFGEMPVQILLLFFILHCLFVDEL